MRLGQSWRQSRGWKKQGGHLADLFGWKLMAFSKQLVTCLGRLQELIGLLFAEGWRAEGGGGVLFILVSKSK